MFSVSVMCVLSNKIFWIIGVVIYHGNQPYIVTSRNGDTCMMPAYSPVSHPQNFS